MISYIGREEITYDELYIKMRVLLEKFVSDINNNPHFLVKSDFAKIYQEINDAEYKNLLKFNLLNDMNEFNIFHTI